MKIIYGGECNNKQTKCNNKTQTNKHTKKKPEMTNRHTKYLKQKQITNRLDSRLTILSMSFQAKTTTINK